MSYFQKFKGLSELPPASLPPKELALVWLGALFAAALIAYLAYLTEQPLVLGSFGASIFVLFVLFDSPFAQPRSMIGGHLVATLVGLIFFHLISPDWWSMALALATALSAMQLLKVSHPPAGSNPFIVFLVVAAVIYHNLIPGRTYPRYWI